MEQQHGALRQRQTVQQSHELSLLLLPDEQIGRVVALEVGRRSSEFFQQRFFAALFAPPLNALLVRDAKKPTAEVLVVTQAADVPRRVDERLLYDVQAGLLVMDQLENINV